MQIKLGCCQVNLCSAPTFMGHEEIVVPMLVLGSPRHHGVHKLGSFRHCMNDEFRPNDLANTAAGGYTAGAHSTRVGVEQMYLGHFPDDWRQVPEISAAVEALGAEYAFFHEKSMAPLHDAFICRYRFIRSDRLSVFCPELNVHAEARQITSAHDVLDACLGSVAGWETPLYCGAAEYCRRLYGNYFRSQDFRNRYGDFEQFDIGYAIWIEGPGVLRAWTRITYVPK